jgi:hypothetical protein
MVLEGKLAPPPVFPDTALAGGTDVFMKARSVPQLHHVFHLPCPLVDLSPWITQAKK